MKRREFITLLGGAAAAWPLAARAQQPAMPVIGFLHPASPDTFADRLRAFRQGLKETGYIEGRERGDRLSLGGESTGSTAGAGGRSGAPTGYRDQHGRRYSVDPGGEGSDHDDPHRVRRRTRPGRTRSCRQPRPARRQPDRDQFPQYRTDGQAAGAAARADTRGSPRGSARQPEQSRKRGVCAERRDAAAGAMGLHIQVLNASNGREIDAAFANLVRERPQALFVGTDPAFNNRRMQFVLQAMRHSLPATYASREYAEAGGLMSYGTDFLDTYRQVGAYTGRILKGAKPADLPVVQSTKFELVINHKTARILGLEVPPTLLAPPTR